MLNWNEIGQYRENNRIEAKKALGGLPHGLWETYSAFANTQGGVILLGVEERTDKSLLPIALPDPEKLVKDFWDTVNNRQKVSANILTNKHVQIVEAGGHRIVAIDVPRANRMDKPVYIGSDPFAGSYRRDGEGDYHCTKDEVRNMMRDQSNTPQDSRLLEQLELDAFDYDSVRSYRIRLKNTRPGHVWEKLEPVEFLQKLGCIGRAEDGSLHPTAAGVLMFGFEYEIVKEYPAYFLDYQEHDDEETRWTDRIVSNLGDWSGNLFDFYFRICNRIIQEAKTPFKLEGMTRVDDTPVHKALREALANSLIHANYYDRLGLVVHRRPQSITISNPGGLRISLEDALDGGISDPRNFTLFKMFNMLNIGERAGSGIPNIYYVWKTQGWQEPTLIEQFNPDRTILSLALTAQKSQNITSNITKNITVNKTQKKILELMLENPSITTEMMSSQIGIADRNIKTNIKKLRDSGLIDRVGARKNGDWIVKEEQ
ncbi:MAG: putative DNA binding domain-containing protein [Clostridiales bacterium]|nr:putative DNA binding domain-containing protein [Clostridiales bacterium]